MVIQGAGSSVTKTMQSFINTKGHEQSLHTGKKRERNHMGIPDACGNIRESLIFKLVSPDEKSKGVAGKVR